MECESNKEDDEDLQTFAKVLSKLLEKGCISPAEKQAIENSSKLENKQAALLQLMKMKENVEVAGNMLLVLRNGGEETPMKSCYIFVDEDNKDNDAMLAVASNAMLTDMVIKCVYGFLNIKEIKKCRTVCRKWNSIAEPIIRKKAKIVFALTLRPEKFGEVFTDSLPELPFTSFVFKNFEHRDVWSVSELTNFFNTWGSNVKELEFDDIMVENEDMDTIENCDIGQWISNLNLNKLKIKCEYSPTKLVVPLNNLLSIDDVTLVKCILDIPTGINRITFLKIHLHGVNFRRDEIILESFRVNDIINFSNSTDIFLKRDLAGGNNVILDVSTDNVDAKDVILEDIIVNNMDESNWNIKSLKLAYIPFLETTGMMITELSFDISRPIDLFVLPKRIEKIKFECCERVEAGLTCSHPIQLQNLKYLHFERAAGNISPIIFHFANSPNLVSLYISGSYCIQNLTLNLNSLPRSVKRLKLRDYIKIIGHENFIVDTLILEDYFFINANKLLAKIKPKVLVVSRRFQNEYYETEDNIVSFLFENNEIEKMVISLDSCYWYYHRFNNSKLAKHVDKESCYFVFKNQFGTSLTSSEFERWMELNPDPDF